LHFLYNISIYLYTALMRIAALFHPKAKKWIEGRNGWLGLLSAWRQKNAGIVYWFHCASVGEFEQGRPLIEALREKNSSVKIVLTFFSPSGYEMRKDYPHADLVMYLPADTTSNVSVFLDILKPEKVFFIKYEYWANYFFGCKKRNIPLYIVSGILRPEQRFFGVFKPFWKKVLACVHTFFVQNKQTEMLLHGLEFSNVVLTGDTRYDRVTTIAKTAKPYPQLEKFSEGFVCLVGGSTWRADEEVLQLVYENLKGRIKLLIVPHEISENHIAEILRTWPHAELWTKLTDSALPESDVLILDTMGMLSAVYRYADTALIGGGFGAGIHNTLEAAVWGVPVAFGPRYGKFQEAIDLLERRAAVTDSQKERLAEKIIKLCLDGQLRGQMSRAAAEMTAKSTGATALILNNL